MGGLFGLEDPQPNRKGARRHVQLSKPVFSRPAGWRFVEHFPELSGFVALDSENKDPGITAGTGSSWSSQGVGFTTGWSVSADQGDVYLSLRHSEGNIDPEKALRWLAAQAAKPEVTFVYANAPYDLGWLRRANIQPKNLPIDVQAMAMLLDEHRFSSSLDTLAREELGERKGTDTLEKVCAAAGLIDPMAHMDMIPAWVAEEYSLRDARLTMGVFKKLAVKIEKENLTKIHELERECALVAVDLKERGVRVNLDRAAHYMALFETKRDAALREVARLTGVNVTANDMQALVRALRVENPRLELPQTATGKDSIRKEVLDALPDSPVAVQIKNARRYDKAIGTFFEGHIFAHEVNGRIHADFHPLRRSDEQGTNGTITGRLSCSSPNLQQLPRRFPEIGDAVRECFEPEAGERWVSFDYSSQEPRIATHFAALSKLPGASEMVARFVANPRTDLHKETALRMSIEREQAKTINLAILYGAGGAKICKQLGLPTEWWEPRPGTRIEVAGREGKRLIKLHEASVPFMRALQKKAEDRAKDKGVVRTVMGRACHFQKRGGEYEWTYAALNKVIQGSAADQMKMAMALLRRANIPLMLTVHDAADFSLPFGAEGDRTKARIVEVMQDAIQFLVPSVVDCKEGLNWGSLEKA